MDTSKIRATELKPGMRLLYANCNYETIERIGKVDSSGTPTLSVKLNRHIYPLFVYECEVVQIVLVKE